MVPNISVIRGIHAIFPLNAKNPNYFTKKPNPPDKPGKECYKEDAPDRTDSGKKIKQARSKQGML